MGRALSEYEKRQRLATKNAYLQSQIDRAEAETSKIKEVLNQYQSILTKRYNYVFDINKLKVHYSEPAFQISNELNNIPQRPDIKNFSPKPLSFFISILPKSFFQKKRQEHNARVMKGVEYYEQALKSHEIFLRQRNEKIELARQDHLKKCELERLAIDNKNNLLDELEMEYKCGKIEATISYLKLVIENLPLPNGCKNSFNISLDAQTKQLHIQGILPPESTIPTIDHYVYLKTKNEIKPIYGKPKEIKNEYVKLINSISLRILFEAFKVDIKQIFQTISFDGYLKEDYQANDLSKKLVNINISRKDFSSLDLNSINRYSDIYTYNSQISSSTKSTDKNNSEGSIIDITGKDEKIDISHQIISLPKNESTLINSNQSTSENLLQILEISIQFANIYFSAAWANYIQQKEKIKQSDIFLDIIAKAHDHLSLNEKKRIATKIINRSSEAYEKIYLLCLNDNFSIKTCYNVYMNTINGTTNYHYNLPLKKEIVNESAELKEKVISQQPTNNTTHTESNRDVFYSNDYYKLGTKYKDKLELKTQEVLWLNKFNTPDNVFISIEGCCIDTIKLYLATLKELNKRFKKSDTTIAKVVHSFKDDIVKLQSSLYGNGSYVYYQETAESSIFLTIFKRAENVIRDRYFHKRKISDEFGFKALSNEFDSLLGNTVNEILNLLNQKADPLHAEALIELNSQNTARWKNELENILDGLDHDQEGAINKIYQLGEYNIKNPIVENIYYEACKAVAKYDKEEAIKLYLYYVNSDLKSQKIDNKTLPKAILNILFANKNELLKFQQIVDTLIDNNNLKIALENVGKIYEVEKKKIKIDQHLVEEVKFQHSETVEILSQFLTDEEVPLKTAHETQQTAIVQTDVIIDTNFSSNYANDLMLNEHQVALLNSFKDKTYTLSNIEIDEFAKSRHIFKSQLIDSINEQCYEVLDDLLIEETEEGYLISTNYYEKILKHE